MITGCQEEKPLRAYPLPNEPHIKTYGYAIESVAEFRDGHDGALRDLVMRCMAEEPRHRPTFADLVEKCQENYDRYSDDDHKIVSDFWVKLFDLPQLL